MYIDWIKNILKCKISFRFIINNCRNLNLLNRRKKKDMDLKSNKISKEMTNMSLIMGHEAIKIELKEQLCEEFHFEN